jgi:hypothetical protein
MNRQFLRTALPLSVCLCLAGVVPVVAQPQPDATTPFQPPALRFDAAGMTLLDAVRLTLQNDPTIKLREADIVFQQGVVRTQKGLFDSIFRADGAFGREQVELLQSQKQDLLDTRSDLQQAIVEATDLTQSLTTAGALLADKNQAYNNPAGLNLSGIRDANVLNQMSILQSQLVLYRDLLASPTLTDQTVRNDIVALREQTVGKNIDYFNSQQAAIANIPGDLKTRLANLGPAPEEQWDKRSNLTVDLSKLLRNGMSLHPYVDLRHQSQNYVGKKVIDPEFGGLGIAPVSTGKIGFDVVLPLLRGRGRDAVAAAETASTLDLEATRLDWLFQQSRSVLATIEAYWQTRAAAGQVDVLRRSVEIEGELATITRSLIAGDRRRAQPLRRRAAAIE